MSRRHTWLRFVAGGAPLPHDLRTDAGAWQRALADLHRRWYGVAPAQVPAVFVLQWLLQVVAHTAAHAAASGPWRARITDLTFSLGPALVPDAVRLTGLTGDDGDLATRMEGAEADYRVVAEPLAHGYPSPVRLGPHTRSALVDDMWRAAAREAETAVGLVRPGVPARDSCCLLYALPGCVECAGCPRLRRPRAGSGSTPSTR